MPKNTVLIIIIGICLIIIMPVMIYIILFAKSGISSDITDWANFSTYWNTFISLANLILFGVLTYFIHLFDRNRRSEERDRDAEIKRRDHILDRPVLVFSKQRSENWYDIKNVGKGAAIDPIVKSKYKIIKLADVDGLDDRKWESKYIIYPMMSGEVLSLEKAGHTTELCAEYKDVFGNTYYSFIDNDRNRIFGEDEVAIYQQEYGMIMQEALETVAIK